MKGFAHDEGLYTEAFQIMMGVHEDRSFIIVDNGGVRHCCNGNHEDFTCVRYTKEYHAFTIRVLS